MLLTAAPALNTHFDKLVGAACRSVVLSSRTCGSCVMKHRKLLVRNAQIEIAGPDETAQTLANVLQLDFGRSGSPSHWNRFLHTHAKVLD